MRKKKEDILSRVLTTGADGMVGSYVDFGIKTNRRSLDVTDLNEVISVCNRYKPKAIFHLAAETDFDRCERDPQYAYMMNTVGVYNMAVAAKAIGAKFIYISTSAVFNGQKKVPYRETDIPDPQSYYGRSKFLGELIVQGLLEDYIIGRICWVFGGGPSKDQKFVSKIIRQTDKPEIKVIADKRGSPTYAKDLVRAIKMLILADKTGIFHLSNKGTPTRAGVVSEIIKVTNSGSKIKKVSQNFFSGTYSNKRLDNESMVSKIKMMRPWQNALREYIQNEWADYIKK